MSSKLSLRSWVRYYSSPARKGEVQVRKLLGRPSNNLTSGIVGLANVGKSTFFQAITKSTLGNPANYPFATIEPEEARVLVPSRRLDRLAQLYESKRKLPAVLKIFDIAGLVRGASDNKGLGNAFLNDIRAVDGIFQVVRAFRNDDITHIEGNVDSTRDLSIVQDELLLKDMEFIESAVERLTKQLRNAKSKQTHEAALLKVELDTLNLAYDLIMDGQRVINKKDWTNDQIDALNVHTLLTAKPAVFLVNVNEEDYLSQTNEFLDDIKAWVDKNAPGSPVILFSASYETKLNEEESLDPSDITLSPESSALPNIIHKMRESLQLISFYTCGPIEARQWTVRSNTLAPQAAGVIHTDFENTFINAEVIKYDDIKDYEPPFDEKILRSKGKISRVGKNYVVEDGDLITFKAAAAKSRK